MGKFKINKESLERLNDTSREKIMPKEKIFEALGNINGKVLADIGCGTGYYSEDFSKLVGESGQIFAIDSSPEMIEILAPRIKELSNVTSYLSTEEAIPVESSSVDIAVSISSFHEFDNRKDSLKEISRILKDNGKLLIIDFKPEASPPPGPPVEERIPKNEVILTCQETGFKFDNEYEISSIHYCLMFSVKH